MTLVLSVLRDPCFPCGKGKGPSRNGGEKEENVRAVSTAHPVGESPVRRIGKNPVPAETGICGLKSKCCLIKPNKQERKTLRGHCRNLFQPLSANKTATEYTQHWFRGIRPIKPITKKNSSAEENDSLHNIQATASHHTLVLVLWILVSKLLLCEAFYCEILNIYIDI